MIKEVYEQQLAEVEEAHVGTLLTRSDQPEYIPKTALPGQARLVSDGDVMGRSLSLPFRFPKLILPVVGVFLLQVIFLQPLIQSPSLRSTTLAEQGFLNLIMLVIFVLFFMSFFIVFAGSTMLEMVQQKRNGNNMSYFRALGHSAINNLPALVRLAISFTFKVLIVSFIAAVLKGSNRNSARHRIVESGERVVQDYMLMRAFLLLPAIAWEDLDYVAAGERVERILKVAKGNFGSGFIMYNYLLVLLYIPVLGIAYLGGKGMLPFSGAFLIGVLVYILALPYYTMSIQIIYAASLYDWFLQYEAHQTKLSLEEARDLQLDDVPLVHLLDEPLKTETLAQTL